MRCQGCAYPLWNLKARQCPERGRPFLPSQFEFVPSSVRFCCPRCGQDYYGTDQRGHLVPDRFDCVRCSRPLAMDEMVLLPTQGVEEDPGPLNREGPRRSFRPVARPPPPGPSPDLRCAAAPPRASAR